MLSSFRLNVRNLNPIADCVLIGSLNVRLLQEGPLRWTVYELVFQSIARKISFNVSGNFISFIFGVQFEFNFHESDLKNVNRVLTEPL